MVLDVNFTYHAKHIMVQLYISCHTYHDVSVHIIPKTSWYCCTLYITCHTYHGTVIEHDIHIVVKPYISCHTYHGIAVHTMPNISWYSCTYHAKHIMV